MAVGAGLTSRPEEARTGYDHAVGHVDARTLGSVAIWLPSLPQTAQLSGPFGR